MPKNLQIKKLRKLLKSKGIEPDLIDLEALVDSTLTYPENKKRVLRFIGKRGRGYTTKSKPKTQKAMKIEEIYDTIHQAGMFNEMRSDRSRKMDERKKAKFPLKPDQWFAFPNRYDLPFVDHPSATIDDYIDFLNKKGKKKKKKSKPKKRR